MSVLDVSAVSYIFQAPSSQPAMSAAAGKAPSVPRSAAASSAQPPPLPPRTPPDAATGGDADVPEDKERQQLRKEIPGILTRLYYQTAVSTMQGLTGWGDWYRDWAHWMSPPTERPDIVKTYESRPGLPVR